jgi:hypothetical protein
MTESGWATCADPYEMAYFLNNRQAGWRQRLASWLGGSHAGQRRKLHLFACACCRRLWQVLPDERSRNAVEICERYVDGQARKKELQQAAATALDAAIDAESPRLATGPWVAAAQARAAEAVVRLLDPKEGPIKAAIWLCEAARAVGKAEPADATKGVLPPLSVPREVGFSAPSWQGGTDSVQRLMNLESLAGEAAWKAEAHAQCDLLRDIFGNPFQARKWNPAWRAPEVVKLAQHIYQEGAFDHLPELADILKQAGGLEPDILGHCQSPGPHVRGCWVLDLILSKD